MRRITISVLSVFVVLPAFANVRLPVVNVASGGVSARAAFGEEVSVAKINNTIPVEKKTVPTRTRNVIARSANVVSAPKMSDVGEAIVASNDVLMPRRPSNDLWAKSASTLRMPHANEFSVYRSDNLLPEESLDSGVRVASARVSAVSTPVANDVPVTRSEMAELDAQIAHLADVQRRLDNEARAVSPRVISAPLFAAAKPSENTVISEPKLAKESTDEVSLRRLVVPMDSDDVIVRSVEKNKSPRIAAVRDDMSKLSPSELRRAFRKTFLSENKHFSTYSIDDRFDVASDMSESVEGFTARSNLSEGTGIKKLEIKITFRNEDSALTRDN